MHGLVKLSIVIAGIALACIALYFGSYVAIAQAGGRVLPDGTAVYPEVTVQTMKPMTPDESALAARIHYMVNNIRMGNGLDPLKYDPRLSMLATSYSQDMGGRGFFSHVTPEGLTTDERAKTQLDFTCNVDHGTYITYGIGENIEKYVRDDTIFHPASLDEKTAGIVDIWMNSPEHRDNILSRNYQSEGIGVSEGISDIYITEDFC